MVWWSLILRRCCLTTILAALVGSSSLAARIAGPDEAEEVIDRVLAAVQAYDLCSIDAMWRRTRQSADTGNAVDRNREPRPVFIRRGANQIRFFRDFGYLGREGSVATGRHEYLLFDTGEVLSGQQMSAEELTPSEQELLLLFWSERLGGAQHIDQTNMVGRLGLSSVLLWYVGRTSLRAYLSEAVSVESADTTGVYRIEAKSDYGWIKMSVSEESGWLPTGLEVRKVAESLTLEGPLSRFYEGDDDDENVPEIRSITWWAQSSDFRVSSDGRIAPYQFTISTKLEYADRDPLTVGESIEVERLLFGEPQGESDFDLGISIPVGYPVTVADATHLPFRWDGERPVPGVPEVPDKPDRVFKTIEASGGGGRMLLIVLNAALVLILLLLWWRKGAAT